MGNKEGSETLAVAVLVVAAAVMEEDEEDLLILLFLRHPPPTGTFLRVPPRVQYLHTHQNQKLNKISDRINVN